jgi:hypothetical protein
MPKNLPIFSTCEGDKTDVISTTMVDIECVQNVPPTSRALKTQTVFSAKTRTMKEKLQL